MKRFLTSLSVVIMMCLVCISCKKDDETKFPATINSGLWYGANASTGYGIDVEFTVGASEGNYCEVAITSPDGKNTNQFAGHFTYNAATGTIVVTFDKEDQDGAATGATFQFDNNGEVLSTTIASTTVTYGSYNMTQVTYPGSIAGAWAGKDAAGNALSVKFDVYGLNGGVPATITFTPAGGQPIPVSGKYNYDASTGKITVTIEMTGAAEITAAYNAKTNLIDCAATVAGAKYEFALDRVATKSL